MMADILQFTDSPIIDESIEEYEYQEYEPITGTSLNNGGDVRISIESQDDDAIFRGAAAGAGKVSLDKLSWFIPHVMPDDAEKCSIYKTIESKVKVPVAYKTRQCDMLSVPKSTSFTWRLSVKTAQEKPRFYYCWFSNS